MTIIAITIAITIIIIAITIITTHEPDLISPPAHSVGRPPQVRLSCGDTDAASYDSEDAFINAPATLTLTDTVSSYYVRRELRELTLRDRNLYLDGFLYMHNNPTHEGKEKFGRYYRSLADFEIMHLSYAGARGYDHMHDGIGLPTQVGVGCSSDHLIASLAQLSLMIARRLSPCMFARHRLLPDLDLTPPQHIAMTAEFELALQSVFPEATVPYWDYTIDAARVAARGGDDKDMLIFANASGLFSEDFFGSTDSRAHTVTKGRFAYQVGRAGGGGGEGGEGDGGRKGWWGGGAGGRAPRRRRRRRRRRRHRTPSHPHPLTLTGVGP